MSKLFKRSQSTAEGFSVLRIGDRDDNPDDVHSFFAPDKEPVAPTPAPVVEPPAPTISSAAMESMILDIQRKAYEEGFSHGERQGTRMGEEKLKALFSRFEDLFHELAGLKERLFREAERDILLLSLEIARKIVRKAVRVDEEILQTLIQITLGKVARHSRVRIFINPADYQALTRAGDLLDKYRMDFETLDLVPDDKVEVGGCLVESSSGLQDARISEQFREVEKELLELLPGV